MRTWIVILVAVCANAQLMISGNENKIDLTSGVPVFVEGAKPDSLTFVDFAKDPPIVTHLDGISNSVIGPPSNIALAPDDSVALVASSIKPDPAAEKQFGPDNRIFVLDLASKPPKVIQEVITDPQPSGLSISRDGAFALVANRAAGTISMLRINGKNVSVATTLPICKPEDNIADVAIAPDGKTAIASVCDGGYLVRLRINGENITVDPRKISTYGKPYRCIITPDGALAVTAGAGQGLPDSDAITVVDLQQEPPRTIDYVAIGAGPESIEISPDGRLLAAVLIGGSNLPKDAPFHEAAGKLVLLARRQNTFEVMQTLPTGAIPEGVAFTRDGRKIVVGCHPARELWVYDVVDGRAVDRGNRIAVPGMPSSLRAADKPN